MATSFSPPPPNIQNPNNFHAPSRATRSRASISHLINHSPPSPNSADSRDYFPDNNQEEENQDQGVIRNSYQSAPVKRDKLVRDGLEGLSIDEDVQMAISALDALKSGKGKVSRGGSIGGGSGTGNGNSYYNPRYEELASNFDSRYSMSNSRSNAQTSYHYSANSQPQSHQHYTAHSAPSSSSTDASTSSLNPETSSIQSGYYEDHEPPSPLTSGVDQSRSSFDVSRSSFDGDFEDCEEGYDVREEIVQVGERDGDFITRVSKTPLVSGAISLYEQGKNSHRVVKYGAQIVESGVKTIYGPVFDRVGGVVGQANLTQLDEFACRQLDRFEGKNGASGNNTGSRNSPRADGRVEEDMEMDSDVEGERRGRGGRALTPNPSSRTALGERQRSTTPSRQTEVAAPRSRWQNIIVEASMTAGGIGAAVSEESMKSLKYCLQWLQWASAHLEHEITVLRDFIASLNVPVPSDAVMSPQAIQNLTRIKLDVVETIRKVVDVVSKYAGSALPENAQRFVRQSILSLPIKWAEAVRREPNGSISNGCANGNSVTREGELPTKTATQEAAGRILTFAVESLDMLKNVTSIFGESVERAEAWIERFRFLNAQRLRNVNSSREDVRIMDSENEDSNRGQSSALPTTGDNTFHRSRGGNDMEVDMS